NGFGDGKYGPDDILTREQMAQVLTNAFKFKATKTTSFTDIDKNSWALKAISALEENGVTIGTGGNMYSPYTHVTREQYSQFLYNSINAVEKETKPEVKPDPKPEEKPEVKPDPKPETKPDVLDDKLISNEFTFNKEWYESSKVINNSSSIQAQSLINEVNKKYNTNLKYAEVGGVVRLVDNGMYLPEGSLKAQFYIVPINEGSFKIIFLDNNDATVALAKKWTTLLKSDLNLDEEIQETVESHVVNTYEKGKYKVRIGNSTADHMMYVQVESK
ncbi:S-layer homology domain-containing protein, partial [Bacillus thuringiensis]|nr:S-layer homology domain-containing protein [Bacillus thuringiensis]